MEKDGVRCSTGFKYWNRNFGEKTLYDESAAAVQARADARKFLERRADRLEKACLDTIEGGIMTGDLAALAQGDDVKKVDTAGFIAAIADRLRELL